MEIEEFNCDEFEMKVGLLIKAGAIFFRGMKMNAGLKFIFLVIVAMNLLLFQNCSKRQFQTVELPSDISGVDTLGSTGGDNSRQSCIALRSGMTTSCSEGVCSAGSQLVCNSSDGSGVRVCDESGHNFSQCNLDQCSLGFKLVGGVCTLSTCEPGTKISCADSNGIGFRICDVKTMSYGSCIYSSCAPGFDLVGQKCIEKSCAPNSYVMCSDVSGQGVRTCNSNGNGYSSCQYKTCNEGFHLDNQLCIQNTCVPGEKVNCTTALGSGTMACNGKGSGYESCLVTMCNDDYKSVQGTCVKAICATDQHLTSNGGCESNTRTCTVTNGSGVATWDATKMTWGSCQVNSCSNGTEINDSKTACVACTEEWVQASGTGQSGQSCQEWLKTTRIKLVYPGGEIPGYCLIIQNNGITHYYPISATGQGTPAAAVYTSMTLLSFYRGGSVYYAKKICK